LAPVVTHVPPEQMASAAQRALQEPQFAASFRLSTQRPAHRVWPEEQVVPPAQAPAEHVCPEVQACPQVPQFAASV